MSSLRIAPSSAHPTSTSNSTAATRAHNNSDDTSSSSTKTNAYPTAPSAPGLPDTLRASSTSTPAAQITSNHPLEPRLAHWTQTQQQLQHTLLRRTHGLADPLRRAMELHIVRSSDNFRPTSLLGGPSRIHDDILSNRDASIDWEDVYADSDGAGLAMGRNEAVSGGFHAEMEKLVGMKEW